MNEEREIEKSLRKILRNPRREKCRDISRKACSILSVLCCAIAFFGMIAYVMLLFYYRKFPDLPQWVKTVFVPKTPDGNEVLVKFTDAGIKACNSAVLIVGIITVIFAIISWIFFQPKASKLKTLFTIASAVISIVGGVAVLFMGGIPVWIKIALTAVGSVAWFILVSLSGKNEEYLGVFPTAIAMLIFTAACWVYVGAANWWR